MSYEKTYIGKGKETPVKSVQCTITKANFDKYAHEYNGELMLTFEVAEMRQPDQYGKTHTIYVNQRVDEKIEKLPSKAPEKVRYQEPEDSDLPF